MKFMFWYKSALVQIIILINLNFGGLTSYGKYVMLVDRHVEGLIFFTSKHSSFASDNGSPNLRSGHLSRSSSLSSQVECGRELLAGNDDVMFTESARRSPGSTRLSNDGCKSTDYELQSFTAISSSTAKLICNN